MYEEMLRRGAPSEPDPALIALWRDSLASCELLTMFTRMAMRVIITEQNRP